MPRLVLAAEARGDLRETGDHIAKGNPSAARRLVTRLRDLTRMLAIAPATDRIRPEPGGRVRSLVADREVILDRPLRPASGIEVVRGLHNARDADVVLSTDRG